MQLPLCLLLESRNIRKWKLFKRFEVKLTNFDSGSVIFVIFSINENPLSPTLFNIFGGKLIEEALQDITGLIVGGERLTKN